nr:5'-nucleotidase C-terminal domain-containing protein [Halopiger aswanensis]
MAVTHGFRYGLAIPVGETTLEHLYRVFPMNEPVARGEAYGQQLLNYMEASLEDHFIPYVYQQEDGHVRNYSSNVEVVVDPTAKRERRFINLAVDVESVDPEACYLVAMFTRPGDPERELDNCGFPFQNNCVEDGVVPVDVIVDYLKDHSPIEHGETKLVRTSTTAETYRTHPPTVRTRTSNPVSITPSVRSTVKHEISTGIPFPLVGRNPFR